MGDETPIYNASLALMTFQRAYGLFPRILGKGDAAKVRLLSIFPIALQVTLLELRNYLIYYGDIILLVSLSILIWKYRIKWTVL